jgi:hypothetical protein
MTYQQPNTPPSVQRNTIDADAGLLELTARHAELFDQCGGDDDPPADIMDEMDELEIEIATTPVFTPAGYKAKVLVIELAKFGREAMIIVDGNLSRDRERIWPDLPLTANEALSLF